MKSIRATRRHAMLCATFLLPLVAGAAAAAQKPPAACPLLQSSEIDRLVGTKVGESHETDMVIPSGPSKGETMTGCMWGIGERGMVSIFVIRAPSKEQRDAALAKFHQGTEALKARGWTGESKDIGGARCGTLVPPPKESESQAVAVGCMGEAKGMALSVSSMILHTSVPPEKIKALFDAAVARLP
jgi:hypothetical protein